MSIKTPLVPILWNHDQGKPIGWVNVEDERPTIEFNETARINKDQLFEIFGGAGILVTDCYQVDGITYVRKCQILEFSLCAAPPHREAT